MKYDINGVVSIVNKLTKYSDSLSDKMQIAMDKLVKIGVSVARAGFDAAAYDGAKDVYVSDIIWNGENECVFIASGRTVGFLEFGTGVHYTETHPKASEYGAVRGGYGYHLGRMESWRYWGDPGTNGEVIRDGKYAGMIKTQGNPPARAMYEAGKTMHNEVERILKEVFVYD